ncbi:hypothetical protein OGAPHI_002173 [Ogataea philodendri]|uniref:Uncharacterized protein n=1 Tax=Ogataea philodendri TaxID=1378263 RepID=A0A9P8T7F3_9ASCO|nr:uncharacterized protein OGAPHI_002173 [Ogataea philodendri]KAH3668419.1 hypothetical protein OGAPHI_002173 [Ogataea philodendri]
MLAVSLAAVNSGAPSLGSSYGPLNGSWDVSSVTDCLLSCSSARIWSMSCSSAVAGFLALFFFFLLEVFPDTGAGLLETGMVSLSVSSDSSSSSPPSNWNAFTALGSEGAVWLPLGRSQWSSLFKHLVNLLQSQTLGFWDQQNGVQQAASAQGSPDEEHLGSKVTLVLVGHVWSNNGDNTVPKPVGSGRETNTSGSDRQWEDLTDNNPGSWTPSRCKEEDVDADEGDHGTDSFVVVSINNTSNSNDELTHNHTESTVDHQWTTSNFLHGNERNWSGENVDDGGDHGNKELVANGAQFLEESGTEVEDEVDTGPLLHHLQRGTQDGLSEVGRWLSEATGEAGGPRANVTGGWDNALFVFVVGHNLGQFLLDVVAVDGLSSESGKNLSSLVELALLDVVSWGVWEQEQTTSQDDSPKQLQTNRNSVGARVGSVLGTVVNTGSHHQSDGDKELVTRNDSTSHLSRRDFRKVQHNNSGHETDTHTGNHSSHHKQSNGGRGSLQNNTKRINSATTNDDGSSTEHVGQITSHNGSHKIHSHDTGNVSRVISEQNTTKSTESTHEISSKSQRSFNSVDVGGTSDRHGNTSVVFHY